MSQGQPPVREVAKRVFAREYNAGTYTFREDDDERAPIYALLPTGTKANRVFIVGTLTETEDVGTDDEYWQGRIVDPTGTVFVYAGQYQPEAASMLRETEPPAFVAVVGKPRTYETDDGTVNVSLRPEHLTVVDAGTRNRWVSETAQRTLERIEQFDDRANEYARMAHEQYGGDTEQYRQAVIEALESLGVTPEEASSQQAEKADRARETEAANPAASTPDDRESNAEPPASDESDDLGDFDPN